MSNLAAKTKTTREQLKAIVQAEIQNCDGMMGSELSNQRAENLDYYNAKPFGNEQAGRSSVVSPDVRDAVEWVMPTLMRIFTSGEDVVEFEPEEEKDILQAKQATAYANFIWNRDNPGFWNFYCWFKDALISKNGVVKIYYSKKDREKRERYSGLDDATFANLVNDPTVTVSEHTENVQQAIMPDLRPNMPPQMTAITTHDVVITKVDKCGRVCVEPMPPEEFLISKDARSIEDARLVGHRRKRTVSSLVEDGFDRNIVESLGSDDSPAGGTGPVNDQEVIARDTVDESTDGSMVATNNPAMRTIWVSEVYVKVDMDGDGIAEMRKVTVAGPGYTLLRDEAWDAPRPFVNLTPVIMPHRFVGLALADLTKVYQLLRSTVLRQYLDNLYLSNNQREEVVASNIIEPSEALSHKPGQKIRVKAVGSIAPIIVPQIGSAAIEGLNYLDQLKENSTGVSARTQGLGQNQLHETAGGERMLMTAAMGKIELIARVFAETGVKDAFRLIHKLTCMYQDQPRTVRLTGQKFEPVDPSSWNADMDMRVSVGLGTGDKDQKMQAAMVIGAAQEKLAALGMVSPQNFMETAEMLVNATGQKGVDRFFTMPDPSAPPKPDPEVVKAETQAKADMAKTQQEGQIKTVQMQQDAAIKQQGQQADAALAQQRMQAEFELKRYQTDQELALKREQLAAELQLKREQLAAELELKRQMGLLSASNDAAVSSDVHVGGDPG